MKIIIKLPTREIELDANEARLVKAEIDMLYPTAVFIPSFQSMPNSLGVSQQPNQHPGQQNRVGDRNVSNHNLH